MKVLNITEGTLLLDDIDTVVLYSRQGDPQEIPTPLASRSRALKYALAKHMLLDVTKGMPTQEEIELHKKLLIPKESSNDVPSPPSPYEQRKAILSEDDHHKGSEHDPPFIPPQAKIVATPGITQDPEKAIIWHGPASDLGGYANMNRKFMFGLSDRGMKVSYDSLPSKEDVDSELALRLSKMKGVRVPKWAPKVYGVTAPLHYDWSRYKILFTMMETRRLHPDYVIRCNCADEIIVPSRWCMNMFKESGVIRPMEVVPLGVDTKIYRPDVEPIGFSKGLKPFVFLSVFGWSLRKGYDVLLKAYLEEFTSDDPVTLLIASRYFGSTDESKKKFIRDEIARIRSLVSNPKQPHVVFFGDVLSEAMMPRLYAAADCYVLISRGEGFGLPFVESGACGLPVIASRYSGQTDFLDDKNSYLVDVDGFRSAEKKLAWISYFYEDAEFPIFGDSAVEQTRFFMRRVVENPSEAKEKARLLHNRITSEYDWNNSIDLMYETLCQKLERLKK